MKRALFFILLFLSGCNDPRVMHPWKIVITSPGGERKEYKVMSYRRPEPYEHHGGQISVRDSGNEYSGDIKDWEKHIIAPVGWSLEVQPVELADDFWR